jgi:hypothetical protein
MTDFYTTLRGLDALIERFIGEGEGVIPFGPSKNLPEHPGGGRLIPGGKRMQEPPLQDVREPIKGRQPPPMARVLSNKWTLHHHEPRHMPSAPEGVESHYYRVSHPAHTADEGTDAFVHVDRRTRNIWTENLGQEGGESFVAAFLEHQYPENFHGYATSHF